MNFRKLQQNNAQLPRKKFFLLFLKQDWLLDSKTLRWSLRSFLIAFSVNFLFYVVLCFVVELYFAFFNLLYLFVKYRMNAMKIKKSHNLFSLAKTLSQTFFFRRFLSNLKYR